MLSGEECKAWLDFSKLKVKSIDIGVRCIRNDPMAGIGRLVIGHHIASSPDACLGKCRDVNPCLLLFHTDGLEFQN